MSVHKREGRGGWFVDFVFEHADGRKERVRKRSPGSTRRDAEEFERLLRADMLRPERAMRREVPTLNVFAEEFDRAHTATRKHATHGTYRSTIKVHLIPAFGSKRLDQIGEREIDAFAARLLGTGRSAKTVKNTLGVLSKMLRLANRWGYLDRVPVFSYPKVPKSSFRVLSEDEIARVLDAAGPYWYGPILFGLMTGCRVGEILALTWEQVDLARGVVRIDRAVYRGVIGLPKHDKTREIELNATLSARLASNRPAKARGLVFRRRDGDECAEPRLIQKADVGLRRVAKRAGVEAFGWHVLRHTFASRLVSAGVPLQAVQELLGHAQIAETMRYAHLAPRVKRQAVRVLDGLHDANATPERSGVAK